MQVHHGNWRRGEGGGVLLCPFLKMEKSALILEKKNALIVFISYLKCCLKSIEDKKLRHFSLFYVTDEVFM